MELERLVSFSANGMVWFIVWFIGKEVSGERGPPAEEGRKGGVLMMRGRLLVTALNIIVASMIFNPLRG